jgi:hypothetical protein
MWTPSSSASSAHLKQSNRAIPENALAFIRDRKRRRAEFLKIPDNAFVISGMTPLV